MATMHRVGWPATGNLHSLNAAVTGSLATAVLVVAMAAAVAVAAPPAWAQDECSRQPPEPAETIAEVPWAQHWFAPERVWRLSQGAGTTVAVIDTGVDTRHPQLSQGQIRRGDDTVGGTDGRLDCDGYSHGTAVASIIAAARADGVGFAGLAPRASILPVRVAERAEERADPDDEPPVTPARFAQAIRSAVDNGADVINLSVVFFRDHEAIAGAVAHALAEGVVVVAAVGNRRSEEGLDLTPYPAAYPGVIGVGALSADGLGSVSYIGPEVDLVAPGEAVTAAAAGRGHRLLSGSSFAAPFVSAAAALVLAAEPALSGAEVTERLLATADPGPGTPEESGLGVVNPYRALTERVADDAPVPGQLLPPVPVDEAALARAQQWQLTQQRAVTAMGAALGASVLALVGVAVWRRGHRRRWRLGRRLPAAPVPASEAAVEPQQEFYTVPTPGR